jgi:hypothetical protein
MRPSFSTLPALAAAFVSAFIGLTLWSTPAASEELQMVKPPVEAANRPSRGMSKEKVQATYGDPTRKVAPVGQPPIERWEYPSFTVYFEFSKVIHSVAAAS